MALDRTWYNTLVDDDGSGLTGSVWDKADVDSLMDAVDAEIVRVDRYASGFWYPSIVGTGGGTPGAYSVQTGLYSRYRDLVQISGRIYIASKGSLVGNLHIGNLPIVGHAGSDQAIAFGYHGGTPSGVTGIIGVLRANTSTIEMFTGSATVGATNLTAGQITILEVIFGGAFHGTLG